MMNSLEKIKQNWEEVSLQVRQKTIDSGRSAGEVMLLPVSKTHPNEIIEFGIAAGIPRFAENYAQEMKSKFEFSVGNKLDQPEWHFIGHLQRNKVKYIAPFVDLIHTVDSSRLAEEISKQAVKHSKTINILLQVNTSGEEAKSGCDPDSVKELATEMSSIEGISLQGLMTIGTFTESEEISRREFNLLKNLKKDVENKIGRKLAHLSMGMSHDFGIAIEEGSTIVRVGTAIFGYRDYTK